MARRTEDRQRFEEEEDDDEVEQRRREYLRRHREMLLQKQRLETERRLQEQERDKAEILKRLDEVRAGSQKVVHQATQCSGSSKQSVKAEPAPSSRDPLSSPTRLLPGIYARVDDLDPDALRLVAQQQSLRDMAPLNTRGKYHVQYMKHRFPIAGSQLKIEKERELCIAAKKKLLMKNAISPSSSEEVLVSATSSRSKTSPMKKSHSSGSEFGALAYRKLDFYVDKMTEVLKSEQESVKQAHIDRQVRFLDAQHLEGLKQFWTLFHASHKRALVCRSACSEAVAWLKAHSFVDVNVPVRLVGTAPANSAQVVIEPNKEVGLTPLMAACRCLCAEMVHALLDQGAAVHLVTANGDTALHFVWRDWPCSTPSSSIKDVAEMAVKAKTSLVILTALISHNIDVNAQNEFGETALQFCARFGLDDCVKLLLAHHADAFAQDRQGKSAISYAQENNHDHLYRMLLHHDAIERTKAHDTERKQCEKLLQHGRGALTADWSPSPTKLFARLLVEDQRAGHLRSQYVDRRGAVIVCKDDDDDD